MQDDNLTDRAGRCHCGNGLWTRKAGPADECTICGCYFKQEKRCDFTFEAHIAMLEADINRYRHELGTTYKNLPDEHPLRAQRFRRIAICTRLIRRYKEKQESDASGNPAGTVGRV